MNAKNDPTFNSVSSVVSNLFYGKNYDRRWV